MAENVLLTRQYEAIIKANNQLVEAQRAKIAGDYAKLLKRLKVIVADTYEQYAQEGRMSWLEMQRYQRIRTLKDQLNAATDTGTDPIFRRMQDGLTEVTAESYFQSVNAINAVANSNIGPVLSASEIQAILDKPWSGLTLAERIGLRRTDIGNRIQSRVLQGVIRGDTYEEMAGGIKETITKDYAKTRAMMEDMAHQYQDDALVQSFKDVAEEDIEITKTWVTAGDERVRDSHAAMDGQTVGADEYFVIPPGLPNSGAQADGPGLFGIPEEDINCRCWIVAGVSKRGTEE